MIIEWTEEAIADIEAQREFIARDSPAASDRVAAAIQAAATLLEVFPDLGRAVPGLPALVKIEPRYRYKLPYEIDRENGVVRILRVFYSRQNRP